MSNFNQVGYEIDTGKVEATSIHDAARHELNGRVWQTYTAETSFIRESAHIVVGIK